ncbi:MAG TPA: shikimate dehydrogenase [Solirubrobacteraceae bacterium]|nr:shikimate dehydrogenase [Solirubrobacteraceae bacterium]
MNRLGVLGWPVAHSRSPALQNAALRAAGLDDWHYQLLPVPPELLQETVRGLPAAGFRGANVTIPHKQAALALADEVSARAGTIGAANTLLFRDGGRVWADNTDAPALTQAIAERVRISGSTVVVLGAGGSARAAVWALRDAGAADVAIWNRTPARARELASALGGRAVSDPLSTADILINCTSVGLHDEDQLEALPLSTRSLDSYRVVVDFVYREGGTPLTRMAQASGVPAIDGLELLVGQGALAFELFTGKAAPVQAMRDAVGLSAPTI